MTKKKAREPDAILPALRPMAKEGIVQSDDDPIPDKGSILDLTIRIGFEDVEAELEEELRRLTHEYKLLTGKEPRVRGAKKKNVAKKKATKKKKR